MNVYIYLSLFKDWIGFKIQGPRFKISDSRSPTPSVGYFKISDFGCQDSSFPRCQIAEFRFQVSRIRDFRLFVGSVQVATGVCYKEQRERRRSRACCKR